MNSLFFVSTSSTLGKITAEPKIDRGIVHNNALVTDTLEKIDFKKTETITRLVFLTAWELANRDARIIVDKKTKK